MGGYRIDRMIGEGSFGHVHLAHSSTGEPVAVKLEPVYGRHAQLKHEAALYEELSGGVGIPALHLWTVHGDYRCMVMDLLGPSLEELFAECHHRFSLKTVLMIADQVLQRTEYIHTKCFLHRDIKPHNFLLGRGPNQHLIHSIDFGLSKRYTKRVTATRHRHISFSENHSLVGTARYASINAHLGWEQGRRDDLESVGYMLVYFFLGRLPWQGLKGARTKKERSDGIAKMKRELTIAKLCDSCPSEFVAYFEYCRSLDFASTPDYPYLRQLFQDLFLRQGYVYDDSFDWTPRPGQ